MRFKSIISARAAAAASAVLVVLAMGASPASASTTHAWAQDGFDAANSGFNPNETAITSANLATSVNWQWGILSPVTPSYCIGQIPPVVAGGRLFLSDQGGFAAYNAATGAKLWTKRFGPTDDAGISAMAVSGNTLLVGTYEGCHSVSDPDGTLAAYNVANGALLWSIFRDVPFEHLMTDQGVVVGLGEDAAAAETAGYRVSDGHTLWDLFDMTADAPVSAGGRILLSGDSASSGTSATEAVNIATGAVVWSKPVDWLAEAATPDGKRFVVRTPAGDLMEVYAVGGGVAWTRPGAAGGPTVAVDNSRVYVIQGGEIHTYASSNGAPGWAGGSADSFRYERPVVAGGVVYTTQGGSLLAWNATNGSEILFSQGFGQGYIDHPVVENGRLYVTNGRVLDTYAP